MCSCVRQPLIFFNNNNFHLFILVILGSNSRKGKIMGYFSNLAIVKFFTNLLIQSLLLLLVLLHILEPASIQVNLATCHKKDYCVHVLNPSMPFKC